MSGKSAALKKYLAPKYMAEGGDVGTPGGGEVDEDETPGSSDTESAPLNSNSDALEAPPPEEATPSPSTSIPEPSTATTGPSVNAPVSDADKQQAMAAYLAKQYGQAGNTSGIEAALADKKRSDLISGIGRSLQQMAQARGVANGLKPDYSAWDSIEKHGQEGVTQATAQRQMKIQDFMQKHELGRQLSQDLMSRGSYDQKMQAEQYALKHTQDAANPESDMSKLAVALAHAQFPEIFHGLSDDQKSRLSYDDIKNIGLPATETAAKDRMTLEASRARMAQVMGEKDKQADTAFAGKFDTLKQKYTKDSAEMDAQAGLLDQAAHSQNGIAGNLVKGGALHTALGRVSQGELAMAVDPSLVERAKRLWQQIDEGKTLTDKDVQEYQAIQKGARDSLDKRFQADADQATSSYDHARRAPTGYAAGLVGYKGPEAKQASAPSAPSSNAPTATGKNGEKYVLMNGQWVKQ